MYGAIALGRVRRGGILSSNNLTRINYRIDDFLYRIEHDYLLPGRHPRAIGNGMWNRTSAWQAMRDLDDFLMKINNFHELREIMQGPSLTALRQSRESLAQFQNEELPRTEEELMIHTRDKFAIINNIKEALNDLKREIMVQLWSQASGLHG